MNKARFQQRHVDGVEHAADGKPDTFQRVEVITGIGRRRRFSQDTKRASYWKAANSGAENRAIAASLIETGKLNCVDPLTRMTDALTKLVNLWPASRIDELMPWAYPKSR
jgi:hypothetical protein